MTVYFHITGIEMIDLPKILNGRNVRSAVPNCLNNVNPAIVRMAILTVNLLRAKCSIITK